MSDQICNYMLDVAIFYVISYETKKKSTMRMWQ